jgi:pyrimidine operon attenuation protein/uracil phosphoribosyltransferase
MIGNRYESLALMPREAWESDWIYTYGVYYPRHQVEKHRLSDWSRAVILVKKGAGGAIKVFGSLIAHHIRHRIRDDGNYVITHVPAEPGEMRYLFAEYERGATERLAASIHEHLGTRRNVELASLLVTVRPKYRKQHQCETPARREANVRGLYAMANPFDMTAKTIILVDDVVTTGSTMRECARVLMAAGAARVIGVALARTVHGSDMDTAMITEDEKPETAMVADYVTS